MDDIGLGRRIAAIALVAGLLVGYIVRAVVPVAAMPAPPGRSVARVLIPEGWAFFTRDPRLPSPVAYTTDRDGRWRVAPGRSRGPAGLDKRDRARSAEISLLTRQLDGPAWTRCDREAAACLATARETEAANTATVRTLCGNVGIVLQEVLPWAWKDLPTVLPSRVARLTVAC
ncbi:SdpA family antimicrobial peptide system protein [Micromonospora peucetia]|uniref:Antimicrobial peptide system protein, SdpA family n=1 Tax=Micromonospora peucetia TaxID=47871 RepID=A0A1C6UVY1_9ACTN|nr:SdpA family antimicrobial peptide system protein [Micromonospora peucetia]MCX4387613.1 SdpA family antimicrobial peptide system protein [Micromonospora peucetia]WSA34934.1 SdpA family antimicrobial peptide system protein [Micromonospora peucetia]SCL58244.1 antimicrobial peptide system protein, SdpA family [Micromonospora peucetia]